MRVIHNILTMALRGLLEGTRGFDENESELVSEERTTFSELGVAP